MGALGSRRVRWAVLIALAAVAVVVLGWHAAEQLGARSVVRYGVHEGVRSLVRGR